MDAQSVLKETTVAWRVPVNIRIGYGSSELINSPAHAYETLTHRWPMVRGPYYETAKHYCAASASMRVPAEVARETFIAAAIEAFWSSATWLPPELKYSVAAACWVAVLSYLMLQGRRAS